jgi:acyl carrier protein
MIIYEIKNFFKTDPDFKSTEIDENTPLIETGLLDSFSVIKLVTFLETTFNIKIEIADLNEENIFNMKKIEELVIRKLNK